MAVAERDYLEDLAAELGRLKAAAGLSGIQLAIRCARSRTLISQALNTRRGRPRPSTETVVAICIVLGADSALPLELLKLGRLQGKPTDAGPRAPDGTRQFTRESPEQPDAELNRVFNPLNRENLERSVQWALEAAPPVPLTYVPTCKADGVVSLYYTGAFDLYRPISSRDCSIPLYVGRAMGPGTSRRDTSGSFSGELAHVLRHHRMTIEQCENLSVKDFQVRYLPVERIFIEGAMRLMIGDHAPAWNTILQGFNHHYPGSRRTAKRYAWDVVHPGRSWAAQMPPNPLSVQELHEGVKRHFAETVKVRSVATIQS